MFGESTLLSAEKACRACCYDDKDTPRLGRWATLPTPLSISNCFLPFLLLKPSSVWLIV